MKTKISIILATFFLFINGSCEDDRIFIVQNNSEQSIVVVHDSHYYRDSILPSCLKLTDYKETYYDVKPHSSKNLKPLYMIMNYNFVDTMYLYVINRIDIDTMTCEEFENKQVIKKVWALTKKDAEAMNWTLTYP